MTRSQEAGFTAEAEPLQNLFWTCHHVQNFSDLVRMEHQLVKRDYCIYKALKVDCLH